MVFLALPVQSAAYSVNFMVSPYYPNAYNLRNQLISSGIIVNYQFTSDYDFESLSLAASVVIGRTANGYTVWKDGSGLSFGENQKNKGGRR